MLLGQPRGPTKCPLQWEGSVVVTVLSPQGPQSIVAGPAVGTEGLGAQLQVLLTGLGALPVDHWMYVAYMGILSLNSGHIYVGLKKKTNILIIHSWKEKSWGAPVSTPPNLWECLADLVQCT